MRQLWMGLCGAALFAVPTFAGDEVQLARTVWADYEIYRDNLGPGGAGFYAVTPDGLGGAASGCAPAKCRVGPVSREAALARCREVSPPSLDCIIFADGDRIEVEYELRAY